MNLVEHYTEVARKLREELGARSVGLYIEERLRVPEVKAQLDSWSSQRAGDLEVAQNIKAQGAMQFSISPEGQVRIVIDGSVPSADAKRMMEVSRDIYDVLFPKQMENVRIDERGTPRTMTFDATYALAGLFHAWQENKQQPVKQAG